MDANERFALERRVAIDRAVLDLALDYGDMMSTDVLEKMVADGYDRLAVKAKNVQFLGTFAEKFARQRLRALAKSRDADNSGPPSVLFLCVHNAGRSQMALGFLRELSGGRVLAFSGGSEPAGEINPDAIAVMRELGIDISEEFPKPWTDEVLQASDVVVLMGCGDTCPVYPGKRYLEWEIEDPAGQDLAGVRRVRDDVRARVEALLAEL